MKQNLIVIVTDDPGRSSLLTLSLAARFHIKMAVISEVENLKSEEISLLIVDIDLKGPDAVRALGGRFVSKFTGTPKIFLTQSDERSEKVQANSLGANSVLLFHHDPAEMDACIRSHLDMSEETVWSDSPATEKKALDSVANVLEGLAVSLNAGEGLPKEEINDSSDVLVSSLSDNGISSWLDAVSLHHSYTYRHCMIVAGLAVGVGLHFGMKDSDVMFLSVSAILHDVGKIRIPLNILDKPSKLTDEERAIIEKHPGEGRDILMKDGQFDERVIDMVVHHHELLDGTGYPDGLSGDQISYTVRLLTIVDIYAALIDRRPYKDPLSKEKAFEIMRSMKGKLDMPLLEAFVPILLKNDFDPVRSDLMGQVAV